MGFLSHRVERSEIKPGDHIYTYRAVFTYSHHGISSLFFFFLSELCNAGLGLLLMSESSQYNLHSDIYNDHLIASFVAYGTVSLLGEARWSTLLPGRMQIQALIHLLTTMIQCQAFHHLVKPFLTVVSDNLIVAWSSHAWTASSKKDPIYSFEYGVPPTVFIAKVRGGTCTTAASDPSETVIHRAMYLLQNGFGNYDIFQNNCEDFAMYCKTGLLIMDRLGVGRSGQASSVIGAPLAAILSTPLKLLMPSPVGVATVTAGMYCMSRYATDIGVRSDVIKVAVEDLATKPRLGWPSGGNT
ncbi:hypothetical protein OIU78_015543 [Salix suchowensis]|nr:hypothetical protein OIU78_015543 [Salix suchowensis]